MANQTLWKPPWLSPKEGLRPEPKAAVLVRNGEAAVPWLTKHQLLHDYRGAYTTARTVGRDAIFEFSMHCQRMLDTAMAVLTRQEEDEPEGSRQRAASAGALAFLAGGTEALRPELVRECLAALEYLWAKDSEPTSEYQVTMLLTCDTAGEHTPDRGFDVFTFVQPLPHVEPMVRVAAHPAERRNPTIKDVQWVQDRQHLEEIQKEAGVNEVIMFDSSTNVTEGLQTNFFAALEDGSLQTASDERVLAGTVRKVVLDVAREQGVPVRLECPRIEDAKLWESCFICSTSRLVKPISELSTSELSRSFPTAGSLAHRIEELVLEAVQRHSERLRP